ncbi:MULTISPECIES: WXG100 family type VII secretion target [Oceanobacillus]|uniref:WXG100 family type VII secretion target n=1 Tax=Oceanobacillus TaxID=182709 RepID=UPI0019572CE6
MAGQIQMTPEELIRKAKTYGDSSQMIHDILTNLTNLQVQLEAEWKGAAFEGFNAQFNELSPKVQNFSELLKDIETQLQKTAEAVAQQDQALAQNFGLR